MVGFSGISNFMSIITQIIEEFADPEIITSLDEIIFPEDEES